MSQSESPILRIILANITTPAHAERTLPHLAELADHAFALAGSGPNTAPMNINGCQARILYLDGDEVPSPKKVVFYQDVPGIQIQRVVVDIETETVERDGQPSLPIETSQIEDAREETETYLSDSLEILGEITRSRPYISLSWQDFLYRLELNGFPLVKTHISDSTFTKRPCPLCDVSTTVCTSCDIVMCLSVDCPVSGLVPFQSCSRNLYRVSCLPCMQNARTVPPLGQCPECNLWYREDELSWCMGRPKERTVIHKIPNAGSAREHPPKALVCSYCLGERDLGHKCANTTRCWSSKGDGLECWNICNLCCPAGGVLCACSCHWLCDDCKTSLKEPYIKLCPQCKRGYCFYCKYIRCCGECGRATLCDDCAEEDWSLLTGSDVTAVREGPAPAKLVNKCQGESYLSRSPKALCLECADRGRCVDCGRTCCSSCMTQFRCNACLGMIAKLSM